MVFLSLLLLHVLGAGVLVHGGRYRQATDDCIRNGMVMTNESVIHEGLLSNATCAFLMTGNPYIVLQPIKLNLNESAVIRLYAISRNGSEISKRLITKYYGRYLYNNLIFMARTNGEFALLVLARRNIPIGNFSFVFRTRCFAEMAMESYPLVSSPNLGDGTGISAYELCQYDVYSVKGEPYTIKMGYVALYQYYSTYYDYFTVNGVLQSVNQNQIYSFSGTNKTQIVFRTGSYNYIGVNRGFNGTVQPLASNTRLKHFGSRNMTGDAQVKFGNDWYYIQVFPGINYNYYMSLVSNQYSYVSYTYDSFGSNYNNYYNWIFGYPVTDAHVMCRDAGYATVEKIDSHQVLSTADRFMAHGFMCNGDERKISQCRSVVSTDLQYVSTYNSPQNVLRVTCADNFQFRLSGTYVQVQIFGTWTNICYDGIDNVGLNLLCQEMGFAGLGTLLPAGSYDYSSYYKLYNILCGSSTRIKDCYFFMKAGWQCSSLRLTCISKDKLFLIGGTYENEGYITRNRTLVCQDNFDKFKAGQVCQELGYPGVISSTFISSSFNSSRYKILPLSCNDRPSNGSKCSFDIGGSCPSGKAAGVVCQNVALVGTNYSNEGRVEVYYGGSKGLLCDYYFGSTNGDIICRQLGFENSVTTYRSAGDKYGYGSGIFLLMMYCNGNEKTINQCSYLDWFTSSCYGNQVAGLVCNNNITQCGVSSVADTSDGSTNGYQTVEHAYPWHVHLYPSILTSEWCSGTIIHKYWVLTSASCIIGSTSNYYLDVGKYHNINGGTQYPVGTVILHPDYSSVTEDNNIALVRISSGNIFRYNDAVWSACLPKANQSREGMTCVTTGWNHLSANKYLMAKPIQIQDVSYCTAVTNFDSVRMERFLCSENNIEPSAVFNGESGGPLTCSNNAGQNTVFGIMARSILGAKTTRTVLFTKVEYYSSWITTTINSNP